MPKTGDIVTDEAGRRYIVGERVGGQTDIELIGIREEYLSILRRTFSFVEVSRFREDNAKFTEIKETAARRGWPSFSLMDWFVMERFVFPKQS